MTENPYQVLGATVPPMLGRAALVGRIEGHLLKASPDHVSVVGPAHYGKSVLLRHLADAHREGSGSYLTTVHIDLRRDTPTSDDAFKRRLAGEIQAALRPYRPELSELLEFEDEGVHEVLVLVLDDLESEGARLLAVLDGFDYALAGAGLTRNLWDQLRSLAQKTSLRFVTGSRRPCASCAGPRNPEPPTSGRFSTLRPSGSALSTTLTGIRSSNLFGSLTARLMRLRERRLSIGREAYHCSSARFFARSGRATAVRVFPSPTSIRPPKFSCGINRTSSMNCGPIATSPFAPTSANLLVPICRWPI